MKAEDILFWAVIALVLIAGAALLGVWRLAGAVDNLREDNHHLRNKLRFTQAQMPQRPRPVDPLAQRVVRGPDTTTQRIPRQAGWEST